MPNRDTESFGWRADRPTRAPGWLTSLLGTLGLIFAGGLFVWAGSERLSEGTVKPLETYRALLEGCESPVFALAWSPDGRALAASGFGPTVTIRDRETGRVRSIESGSGQHRFIIGWSGDGRRLIVGGVDEAVEAWDVAVNGPGEVHKVTRPEDRSDASRMISEASRGGPIRVRGSIEWRTSWLPASDHLALTAAFAPDGLSIVTAEVDQALRVWDARSNRLRFTLRGDNRGVSCVSYSPDSSRIASGGGGALRVWDAKSGELLTTLGDRIVGTAVIAFSPDGTRLAGANWDRTIRVWELSNGFERAKLGGHDGQVLSLAWSPDGRTLASGGYDSTVKLWDLAPPVGVARADD
jgi:WD40 repeat protein